MTGPRQSPRPFEDMDTKHRELGPTHSRLFQSLTGVPNTPDEINVYEYGRRIAIDFFAGGDATPPRLWPGAASAPDDLDRAKQELGIETEEQERIATNVSVVYKYLEYQNRRDFDGIIDIHHNPYLNKTYFGRWPISPEAHTRGLKGFFGITPDATTEANKIIVAAGNKVVVRTTARGTQVKSFPNSMLGSGGKQWAVTLIHAVEVVDGRIASCEGTSPFENQWDESFINSNFPGLGGDVSEVRARQGVNADYEYLAEQVIGDQTIRHMHAGSDPDAGKAYEKDVLAMIQGLHEQAPNQCQSLIAPRMRRCAKLRVGDSLYCLHHQEHGYGID